MEARNRCLERGFLETRFPAGHIEEAFWNVVAVKSEIGDQTALWIRLDEQRGKIERGERRRKIDDMNRRLDQMLRKPGDIAPFEPL